MDEKRESRESLFNYTILSPFEMEENSRKSVSRGGGTMARSLCSSRLGCRVENTRRGERAAGNTRSVSNDSWLMVIRKIGGGGWRDNNESDAWLDFIADPVSIYLVPRLFVEADLCSFAVRRKGSFPTRRNNEVQTERSVGRKIKLERKK